MLISASMLIGANERCLASWHFEVTVTARLRFGDELSIIYQYGKPGCVSR